MPRPIDLAIWRRIAERVQALESAVLAAQRETDHAELDHRLGCFRALLATAWENTADEMGTKLWNSANAAATAQTRAAEGPGP